MEGLGERIKLIRGDMRSQEEFAAIIGVDRSTLASWETDRREPDLDKLLIIAKAGGVSLDYLAGRYTASFKQAQAFNDPKWRGIISFAFKNNISPEKVNSLLKAALALKA